MGADGSIVVTSRTKWDEANPEVKPEDIGLYTGSILGVEAAWGYFGDNLDGPNYLDPLAPQSEISHRLRYIDAEDGFRETTAAEKEQLLKAARWFGEHAEVHEVWT